MKKTFTKNPNTKCGYCNKPIFKWAYELRNHPVHFCNNQCKGKWMSKNLVNEKAANWQGGSWNNRVQYLAHTSYRTWRANLLKDAQCVFCHSIEKLELHHVESKILNPNRIKDESNVLPVCESCHDTLHSKSSKGGELRETLNAILAHGNPQPSRSNVLIFVGRKVQRLTGEETTTDKPDTSAHPERDDIVRASR